MLSTGKRGYFFIPLLISFFALFLTVDYFFKLFFNFFFFIFFYLLLKIIFMFLFSRFRKNSFPYGDSHGMGIASGGLVEVQVVY